MCWAFFGCCEDPIYTIIAFDAVTLARQWFDLKDTGTVTAVESALSPWGATTHLASGSRLPNTAGNTENDGALLVRDDAGARGAMSDSSSPVGPVGGPFHWLAPETNSTDGAWLFTNIGGTELAKYFDASLVQQSSTTVGSGLGVNVFCFNQFSTECVVGRMNATTLLARLDASGATIDSILSSALSLTGARTLAGAIPLYRGGSEWLIFGGESGGHRRIWTIDSTLTETGAATVAGSGVEAYDLGTASTVLHRPISPDGSKVALRLATSDDVALVDIAGMAEITTITASDPEVICTDDDTVFIKDGGDLNAYDWSGSLLWTSTNLFAGSAATNHTARIVTAGLACYNFSNAGNDGIKLLDPADGTILHQIDGVRVYDILEHNGQLIAVGDMRSPA